MPRRIHLIGGPVAGLTADGEFDAVVGVSVDQSFQHTNSTNPFAGALYERKGGGPGDLYTFSGFERRDGQRIPIEFVDGPLVGMQHLPKPRLQALVSLAADGTPFGGVGDPTAVAVYDLLDLGGRWGYRLSRLDASPETVQQAVAEVREQQLTMAIRNFYSHPNYSIYSMQPTGAHTQVPLEVGSRKGEVDEGIAPLIRALWTLGLDTLGSCQERPPGIRGIKPCGDVHQPCGIEIGRCAPGFGS